MNSDVYKEYLQAMVRHQGLQEPARFHMLIDTYTGTLLDKVISAGIGVADGQTYEGNPLCSFTTTEDTLIFLEVYNEDINYSVAGHAAWVISLV